MIEKQGSVSYHFTSPYVIIIPYCYELWSELPPDDDLDALLFTPGQDTAKQQTMPAKSEKRSGREASITNPENNTP